MSIGDNIFVRDGSLSPFAFLAPRLHQAWACAGPVHAAPDSNSYEEDWFCCVYKTVGLSICLFVLESSTKPLWLLRSFCLLVHIAPWALSGGVDEDISFMIECYKIFQSFHTVQLGSQCELSFTVRSISDDGEWGTYLWGQQSVITDHFIAMFL